MRRILSTAVTFALLTALASPLAGAATGGPIDLMVTIAGGDATSTPGPTVTVGESVTVTYEVLNTTTDWLWAVYLYQEGVGRVTCPERHLAPGARIVCEVTLTAVAGDFARAAWVTAWPTSGAGVGDEEVVRYTGVTTPSSRFENLAIGRQAAQSSSPQWPVGTTASRAVDGNRDGTLDGGSVSATYRVSDAWWEVDLGAVRSIDHIVLWNRTDCCSERLRRFYVFVSDAPFGVRDIKGTRDQVGVWEFFHDGEAGRRTEIPVGRTGRYVRVQLAYVDAVLALAEVEVMGTTGPPPVPVAPSITLEASVAGDPADRAPGPEVGAGDPVEFRYEVTNTSSERLWALYVHHPGIGRISCPQRNLAAGQTVVCTQATTATGTSHAALVTAQAWSDDGTEAATSDAVHFTVRRDTAASGAAITLSVELDGAPAEDAPGPEKAFGSPLAFTYRITNVGTEPLWALYIDHSGATAAACPTRHLPVGAEVVCTATGTASAGTVLADVSASAWDAAGARASAVDPVAYHTAANPDARSLAMTTRVGGVPAGAAPGPIVPRGGSAQLEFVVVNTGGVELSGLWVQAPGFGTASCALRRLAPGQAVTCGLEVPAEPGNYGLLARAVAYDPAGDEIDTTAPLSFFVPVSVGPAVALEFLVDGLNGDQPAGPRIREGEVMTFSYIVTNSGGVPLTGLGVSDDAVGVVTCPTSTLQPGDTLVCTRRMTARLSEVSVLARVTSLEGAVDTERLYYHVRPYGREDALALEVSINGTDADVGPGPNLPVGSTATIRYVLTNRARVANVWGATILDPRVPSTAMRCTGGPTLGAGQSRVCTATIRIEAGQWSNQIVGYAWSSNGPRIDASDRLHYYGMP